MAWTAPFVASAAEGRSSRERAPFCKSALQSLWLRIRRWTVLQSQMSMSELPQKA